MKRNLLFRAVALALAMVVVVALPLVAGCKKKEAAKPTSAKAAHEDSKETSTTGSETPAVAPPAPETQPTAPAPADGSAETPASGTATPSSLTIRVAWVEAGEAAFATERTIPYTDAPATAAVNELLAGPSQTELTTWPSLGTCIPAGTRLLGLSVSGGVAKVDLSKEFESGGGTFSVTARLAQVVYTLTQFPSIQAVEFYVEGARVEMFSSEGLLLEGPQTIEDYESLLPMDA